MGDAASLVERVANDASPLPEEEAAAAQLRERALGLLLSERERMIVSMRFGIGNAPESTLEEIAGKLGLTRERIRQIEVAALEKLRRRCDAQSFRPELDV